MTLAARAWLPATALSDGVLAAALSERAYSWAMRWFADAKLSDLEIAPRAAATCTAKSALWFASVDAGLNGSIDPQALHNLGRKLMRVETGLQKPTAADQQLFRDLGAACFEDFLRGAAQLLLLTPRIVAADIPPTEARRLRFSACVAGVAFDLYVDDAVAALARKALVGESGEQPALGARAQAIRAQSVKVGAMIGTSQVRLADFYALEAGDVVVLDRGADDEVSLTVDGVTSSSLAGIIHKEESNLRLRITKLESQP